MEHPGRINIESYDYNLPKERIAYYPVRKRDDSRLLIYRDRKILHDTFSNIPDHLPAGSLLFLNETRVVHARLLFRKPSGSVIEIFCLEPLEPEKEVQLAFQVRGKAVWKCLVGNSKRWKDGNLSQRLAIDGREALLSAGRIDREGEHSMVQFFWDPPELTFSEILENFGRIPLPPYIHRESESSDNDTYQTIYATREGSVAAPTAGLHFTEEVLDRLRDKNIEIIRSLLHVGAGTFRPVSAPELSGHKMHSEKVYISRDAIGKILANPGKPRIVVGTTTTRLLESLYWQGVKWNRFGCENCRLDIRQWEPYESLSRFSIPLGKSLKTVLHFMDINNAETLSGETSLIIAPGYRYMVPDIMITNFHQPRSTLLLLIAAFIGEKWKDAYDYALINGFRFLSYGDSCLFFKDSGH